MEQPPRTRLRGYIRVRYNPDGTITRLPPTPDIIARAPQFMNCLGDYEIDLRGVCVCV